MSEINFEAIFAEINASRLTPLSAEIQLKVMKDVKKTLRHIENDPDLQDLPKRTAPQINAAVKHYTKLLAEGATFGEADPTLTVLLTVGPSPSASPSPSTTTPPAASAPAASRRPIPAAPELSFADILRDPEHMRIFRETVNQMASRNKAASVIKVRLDRKGGAEEIIQLFDDMGVGKGGNTTKASTFGDNPQMVEKFLELLSNAQAREVYRQAAPPSPLSIKSVVLPTGINGIKRRRLLSLTVATLAGSKAAWNHLAALDLEDAAHRSPMREKTPLPDDKADEYYGAKTAPERAKTPESIAMMKDAVNKEEWAKGYAIGSIAFTLDAIVQTYRRTQRMGAPSFKDAVAEMLKKMDPIVDMTMERTGHLPPAGGGGSAARS